RAGDKVLHFIQVDSDRTGTLELNRVDVPEQNRSSYKRTFEIERGWTAPATTAVLGRYAAPSIRMTNRTYRGLEIVVEQAIAFVVRWRRDADDQWHTVVLPAVEAGKSSAAWLGETDCDGDVVPVSRLEQGIELDVTATYADGKKRHVNNLDGTVKLPPA